MLCIGVPALPSCALHWSSRHVTRKIRRDIVSKGNILVADQSTIIIVESERIFFSIIIEVEAGVGIIIAIITKTCSPVVCKTTIVSILISAMCRRVSCFRITRNFIPVIHITQVVVPHINRLDATICLALVSRRCITVFVILKPIFEVLVIISGITVTI